MDPQGQAPGPGQSYSVYSANTQGGCNVGFHTGQIRSHDVTFLQESGTPGFFNQLQQDQNNPGLYTGTVNFGTSSREDMRHVVHRQNGRCSQTVLVDTRLGPVTPFTVPGPDPKLRPVVGAEANGVAFGTFHAPSGNHNAAEGVLRHQVQAFQNHGQTREFIWGGDANSDIMQQDSATVNAYGVESATQLSGGNLDGMMCSTGFGGSVNDVSMQGGDHCGIEGQFQ